MDPVILLDMDGVLADFVGAALRVHGIGRETFDAVHERQPGNYDLAAPLGMTENEFWEPINQSGYRFWQDMEPTPWFDRVITLAEETVGQNWFIVTSPCRDRAACCLGKHLWVENHLGRTFDRLIPTGYKHLLARKDAILIDDREETVEKFRKAGGGRGIVFPTQHNSLYAFKHRPVSYVREQLGSMNMKFGEAAKVM